MEAATEYAVPVAWSTGNRSERVAALKLLPHRVQVLLAAEWARSVLSIFEAKRLGDDRPRKAIESAETWAYRPTEENRKDAAYAAGDAADAAAAAAAGDAAAAAGDAADAAGDAADAAAAAADAAGAAADAADAAAAGAAAGDAAGARKAKWKWVYAMYRHARGPGFAFAPEWRTDTAVSLARGIVADRAFDRMPILADALQDAGANDPELMRQLQEDRDEWGASDWAITQLLGMWG